MKDERPDYGKTMPAEIADRIGKRIADLIRAEDDEPQSEAS